MLTGLKRIISPISEALNSSSFMMNPLFFFSVRKRIARVSDLWILAWPMSRIIASYRASMSVRQVVNPGLSSPEMLTWIISMSFVVICGVIYSLCKDNFLYLCLKQLSVPKWIRFQKE